MSTPSMPNSAADPTITNEMIQVVNYEEQFHDNLPQFLATGSISHRAFDYHVASIMGPQSSGKSTLLNLLFGTQFRTMDEASGRYQVTQGVWMGRDHSAGIVVMDLEGTDSRERGEDATTFERKSALFALALSEVLIINLWAHDVGRRNAANMALLQTVMEVDLKLFFSSASTQPDHPDPASQRMHKTRLLFVLRDHVQSPLETLSATLTEDIVNIWNSISKPDAAKDLPLTHFFDLDFFALPHKVLMAKQFNDMGSELRRQFQEGDVFNPEYHSGIAADGFAEYARSVWETIRENKELDIPSQKEMLAHVRCEQIAKEALATVDEALAPLKTSLLPSGTASPTLVSALFDILFNQCSQALDSYNSAAYRYSKTVADMKADDLQSRICADSKMLFDAQISLASDQAVTRFRSSVSASGKSKASKAPWSNWGQVSSDAKEHALYSFHKACDTSALTNASEDVIEGHPLQLLVTAASVAAKRLEDTLCLELDRADDEVRQAAQDHCLKTFQNAFKPPMLTVLDTASEDVWERASEVSSVAWEATSKRALDIYGEEGLALQPTTLEDVVEDEIKPMCYENALLGIKEAVGTESNLLTRMTKRFEDTFRFDERGVPRHFGPNEDLEALFVVARDKGEQLVDLLGEVKLSGPLTDLRETARVIDESIQESTIVKSHARADLREKLKRQAGAVFMEAKRAQEAAKITTKIPIWLFMIILVLGWNEFMAVLKNPLLLVLTVIVVPIAYMAYMIDAPTMLAPAIRTTLSPLLDQAKDFLDRATAQSADTPSSASTAPVAADISPTTSASSSNTGDKNEKYE